MPDFSKINPYGGGERQAFEEFVCQLARREDMPKNSVYKRIEGSGGDGGVEAYWTKPDGKKVGYQAKYFLRSGSIKWDQIDKSVRQALATHPDLEHYVIAVSCNLTVRGWDHWDNRVKKWKEHAVKKDIKFEMWTKSELSDRLMSDTGGGLRKYFFGDTVLDAEWFRKNLEETTEALGERFHSADHVVVRTEELFSYISRNKAFLDTFSSLFEDLKDCHPPQFSKKTSTIKKIYYDSIQLAFDELLETKKDIHIDIQHRWNIKNWEEKARKVSKATNEFRDQYMRFIEEIYKRDKTKQKKEILHYTILEVRKIEDAVSNIKKLLSSRYMKSEQERMAFIKGEAGSGKSHLLGKMAEEASKLKQPAVLLLGQWFTANNIWDEIRSRLDLQGYSAEQILGALDAAGKSAGVRTLLLIDAINEGIGSKFWHDNLAAFIKKLSRFSHICCVISCRSEYFDSAIPENLSDRYETFFIRGFETQEEQLQASRIYLDRRGISRPSTPWLAPEFVNPLFLRSVCLSLEREGKTEIPSGLVGAKKILDYYLESVASDITKMEGQNPSCKGNIARAIKAIAQNMLAEKKDFLEIDYCRKIISEHFQEMTSETKGGWLSVLLNNGVLRKDPNPNRDDYLSDEEVIRFSFQRFQDFLIAEQALEGIESGKVLFKKNGPLEFVVVDGYITREWSGLMSALSIILPEKLGIELPDALPDKISSRWHMYTEEWFKESLRWRSADAFSDRTLKLLNKLDRDDVLAILVQVSVSVNHPYNAERLNSNLSRYNMPDRDAFWTQWLNSRDDEYSEVYVLIDWSLSDQVAKSNPENQKLAALTLCWFLTSSNRKIRDKATKALANLLLVNGDIFLDLLKKFATVDDLYILENLLAAGYGACCLDPKKDRLEKYSKAVFDRIFKSNTPPCGLLLRDYGLGIVELAKYHKCLSSSVDFNRCKPPYKSPKPDLSVTEEQLEKVAEKAGGKDILFSCTSLMGDFGIYEIEPKINRFFSAYSQNEPISKSVEHWVAKRAYDYGWTQKRFANEGGATLDRSRPSTERIGKKYQWLALKEILSMMADHYRVDDEYDDNSPKPYQTPLDIEFTRDIDPTILVNKPAHREILDDETWMFEPIIRLDEAEEDNLSEWPFAEDPAPYLKGLPYRRDGNGKEWLVLYEYQSVEQRYPDKERFFTSRRRQQFRYFTNVLIKAKDASKIAQHLESKQEIKFYHWSPPESTDAGYLFESPWRKTWETEEWPLDSCLPENVSCFLNLVEQYRWESHLDGSLEGGYSAYLPPIWLAQKLGLNPDTKKSGIWLDDKGEVIFQERSYEKASTVVLLRKDAADKITDKNNIFFGVTAAERNAWPGGIDKHASYYRSEGVCWHSARGIESKSWKRPQKRDKQAKYAPLTESRIQQLKKGLL